MTSSAVYVRCTPAQRGSACHWLCNWLAWSLMLVMSVFASWLGIHVGRLSSSIHRQKATGQ